MISSVTRALKADIPFLCQLINSAYRGETAKQGWTHEASLIEGEKRADEDYLNKLFAETNSVILKYVGETGTITGCVYLKKEENDVYLGMLSVQPNLQANGIGRQLITAAEEWTLQQNYSSIIMQVISVRAELINWYNRLGFSDTGVRKSFDAPPEFGKPRMDLQFMILRKQLK